MATSGSGTSSSAGAGAALCTLAQCKEALGLTVSSSDNLVTDLINAATAWAQEHTERTLILTTHTEVFSPGHDSRVIEGGRVIIPREYPIVSVTSLHQDVARAFGAETLVAATDYFLPGAGNDRLAVELLDDGLTRALYDGQGTVQLVYVAGYATIPADLSRAAVMLVVHLFHSADRQKQGIASESIGDHSLTYRDEEMPREAAAILRAYARPWGM